MSADSSRRFLAEAAEVLAEFHRQAGAAPSSPEVLRTPAEAGLRAALEAAERRMRQLEEEAARAKREAAAAAEENRLLGEAVERDAAAAADADALRARAAEADARAASLKERAVLLEADCVRLEALRRKAERAAAEAEAQARAVEDSLRRDLRQAHDALDRAASESGAFQARWKEEKRVLLARAADLEKRLLAGESSGLKEDIQRAQGAAESLGHELVISRSEAEQAQRALLERMTELEKRLAVAQGAGESSLHAELAEARGAADALRRDLAATRADAQRAQDALVERLAQLQKRLEDAPEWGDSVLRDDARRARIESEALRQQLASERAAAEEREQSLHRELAAAKDAARERVEQNERRLAADRAASAAREREMEQRLAAERAAGASREQSLREELAAARKSFDETLARKTDEEALPPVDAGIPEMPPFVQPSIDPVLDPGWSRLMRIVRPPVEAAYTHLRRLSSTALTNGQKTLLRLAAASIAQASDSLSSVELALEEGPASAAPAPVTPVLESCLASWEPAFRQRGVTLAREWPASLPDAAHEPKALRIMLHHVLRNVLEALPRGGRLSVRGSRAADGALRLEFLDDGPGFPAAWLERRFEPFAAPRAGRAGLGLALVRRTLRRWGGDAEAGNNASAGRGARLVWTFAPPPIPEPKK